MSDTPVKLRHLWQACCDIWPDMPPRHESGRPVAKDFDKRAAFCLAAKPFGFSSAQIGNFIRREHSTILSAQRQAMERRSKDSDYGVSIILIRQTAQRLAHLETAPVVEVADEPLPSLEPEPVRDRQAEFAAKFDDMMENGSRALLKALVTRQAHVFGELRR